MKKTAELFSIEGKVAIITGAASGLGFDMASVLAENGASVVITSRDESKAKESATTIAENTGATVVGMALDQRDYASCDALMKKVYERFGKIDILINNAGGGSGAGECNFLMRDPAAIENMIMTNLTGSLFCSRAACPYMAAQKSGKIVNIGSIAGVVGRDREMYHRANKMEQPIEYAAAKGGVISYTRDLAAFMAPYGVTVNCISPGGFDKGEIPPAFNAEYSALTPMRRMGRMQSDLLGAVLYLVSGASSYTTGQNIVIDGGFSSCK